MTIRRVLVFLVVFALMVFGEWYKFLSGFDTSLWTRSSWIEMGVILVAEAFAAAVIAIAVDRALPAIGGRAVPRSRKSTSSRRGSQKYSAR